MKTASNPKVLQTIPFLIIICSFRVPAQAQYGGGSGTTENPYLIYTAEQMNAIGANQGDWDKNFKLMADIDLSSYTGTDFNIIGTWDNPFAGVFDGNGHIIANFTYTSQDVFDDKGLFGCVGSSWAPGAINDLGLINPNVVAGSLSGAGSLVGAFITGAITNCYAEGGSVSGDTSVGGLAGGSWDGVIINCYSTTRVSGTMNVGGLLGDNLGTTTNCYAAGRVSGEWFVGGLVGSNWGEVTGSFWDVETSGQTASDGGTGKTTAEMQMESTFTDAGWDFVGETVNGTDEIWWILEGQDYPRLWWAEEPGEEPEIQSLSDFLAGVGTQDDPYLIYDAEQMNVIGRCEQDWDKHFMLMADIDLSRYSGTDFNIIGHFVDWNDNKPFTGAFDGNGYTISNFSYTSTDANGIGLFGYVNGKNAEISGLGLIAPNIDAGTGDESGSLVGALINGTITNCYAEGSSVSGNKDVGGLVGFNWDGTIIACYSTSHISGYEDVGGLVGFNKGTITNCYSRGSVKGNEIVGGLAGLNNFTITACYSSCSVTGTTDVGGLVGSGGQAEASFWDTETSGQPTSAGGTGKTKAGMQTESTFADAGWDFVDVWRISEGLDYPRLRWERYGGGTGRPNDPYLIYTAEQMNAIGLHEPDWVKRFKLMANIDLSGYTGTDFNIIGYWVGLDSHENRPFKGVFDGNGHTISNFTYTCTGRDHIGLFGYIEDPDAEIKNLGLIDPNIDAGTEGWGIGSLAGYLREGRIINCYVEGGSISGNEEVGGLLGDNWEGIITNCYSTSIVSGNEDVGGLVGDNAGTITNCYSLGSVSGDEWVGGFVGFNWGTITNCYSTGHVEGTVDVGGLVGYGGGAIASFWDIETSGQPKSAGGIGRTTAEMKTASTFVGWSFGPVWTIDEGKDYPRLWWETEQGETHEIQQLSDFLTGAGTENEPYLIFTAEELNMIGLFPNNWDKHFKLMADIDLAEITGTDFNVIGISPDSAFSGVFDGNGRKISNFTYTSTEALNVGLFGYLKSTAVIKDLGLIDPNVYTGIYEMGGWGVGSLVGLVGDGTIISCYVEGGSVTGGWMVGLLIGYVEEGTVTDCYVEGGSVSGDEDIGGLVGFNQGTITNCYAISVVDCNNGGGLVGTHWAGEITNCYSAGSVTGNEWIGGLAGFNLGTITNCYSASSVTANDMVGGLVGDSWGEIMDSFWDIETSGQLSSAGGTGKTTAEMQTAGTFLDAGWDFVDETDNGTEDIWWIDEGHDYPRLWWEAE